jgi:hypothetical protein
MAEAADPIGTGDRSKARKARARVSQAGGGVVRRLTYQGGGRAARGLTSPPGTLDRPSPRRGRECSWNGVVGSTARPTEDGQQARSTPSSARRRPRAAAPKRIPQKNGVRDRAMPSGNSLARGRAGVRKAAGASAPSRSGRPSSSVLIEPLMSLSDEDRAGSAADHVAPVPLRRRKTGSRCAWRRGDRVDRARRREAGPQAHLDERAARAREQIRRSGLGHGGAPGGRTRAARRNPGRSAAGWSGCRTAATKQVSRKYSPAPAGGPAAARRSWSCGPPLRLGQLARGRHRAFSRWASALLALELLLDLRTDS